MNTLQVQIKIPRWKYSTLFIPEWIASKIVDRHVCHLVTFHSEISSSTDRLIGSVKSRLRHRKTGFLHHFFAIRPKRRAAQRTGQTRLHCNRLRFDLVESPHFPIHTRFATKGKLHARETKRKTSGFKFVSIGCSQTETRPAPWILGPSCECASDGGSPRSCSLSVRKCSSRKPSTSTISPFLRLNYLLSMNA